MTGQILVLLLSFFLSVQAMAVPFVIDVNGIYLNENLAQTGSADFNLNRMALDASVGLSLVQGEWFFIGLSVFSGSSAHGSGSEDKWQSTDYGLRLIYFIDRVKQWGLGFAYHFVASGQYESGGTLEYWKGVSYKFDFGYTPLLFHKVYFGLRLNYYLAQYDQSSTNNVTFTSESNKKSFIYPSVYLGLRF